MIKGYLVYSGWGNFTDGTNAAYGCGTFNVSSNPGWATLAADTTIEGVILAIERNPTLNSGCTFSTKVWSAQNAAGGRVNAVIIVDSDSPEIVLMRDDDKGTQVFLSSMFVGSDVWNAVQRYGLIPSNPYAVFVEMEYYLPNPDGRVEMDLLYSILDPSTIPFLTSFGAAARVLAYRLKAIPHFFVAEWSQGACAGPDSSSPRCVANCIRASSNSNSRFYCQSPGSVGLLAGVNGSAALQEVVRQQCLFDWLSVYGPVPSPASTYPEPYSYLMWSYWESFYANCAYANATQGQFSAQCSYAMMRRLAAGTPAVSDPTSSVQQCYTGKMAPVGNAILYFEQLIGTWATYNPVVKGVRAWINNESYTGDVQCRLPITEATCGPLSAICYGYADAQYPQPCLWDNQCTFGTMNCTGISVVTGNSGGSGVSAGTVVGIVIAFLVILTAGLYYWYRRQQRRMKEEVDALLKQYLPMDPGATHGVAQGTGKIREQQERRLIQDMDLEDQDMETRDDI